MDRPRAVACIAVCCLAPCLAGCPVPLATTEVLSPPIAGVLLDSIGLPVPNARVVVATGFQDSACAPFVQRATTDSAGSFHFTSFEKRHRVTWVVPLLDRVYPGYRLCIAVADTLRPAFQAPGSMELPAAEPDSVTCQEWVWERRTRIACISHSAHGIAAGGRWDDSVAQGWYRLILVEEPTAIPGSRGDDIRPHAYLQWIEQSGRRLPYRVRAIIELPIDHKVTALWETAIWRRDGRWVASMKGTRKTFMNDFHRAELTFTLGSPGQIVATELR